MFPILDKKYLHLGILSAMPEEVGVIKNNLRSINSIKFGDLEFISGELSLSDGKNLFITIGWSGWERLVLQGPQLDYYLLSTMKFQLIF